MIKGNEWWFVMVVVFATAFTLGATVSGKYAHRSAIEQSCAHYDGRTGEFKWGLPQ